MAQRLLHQAQQTDLSLPEGSYIYSLIPCADGSLAAISSDDSLRLFDRHTLRLRPGCVFENTHGSGGVTTVNQAGEDGELLATGGRDGRVRIWDVRSGGSTAEFVTGESNRSFLLFQLCCIYVRCRLNTTKIYYPRLWYCDPQCH